jgi:hypothetical protein
MLRMGWFLPTLASRLGSKTSTGLFSLVITLGLYCLSDNALAAIPDLGTVLKNIQKIIQPITALICIISYIGGVFMIFKAIVKLKRMGGLGTQMAMQPGDLVSILVNFLVGAVLLYIPTTSDILTNSLLGTSQSLFGGGSIDYSGLGTGAELMQYTSSTNAQWTEVANTLVLYIQFFGFISFIKGWFMLSNLGTHGTQAGTGTKAVVHIIGGIIAMNFTEVAAILQNTILGTG